MVTSKSKKIAIAKCCWRSNGSYKKQVYGLAALVSFLIFVYYLQLDTEKNENLIEENIHLYKPSKYLIKTSKCRIPDIDPFNKEVIKFLYKEPYTKCTDLELLTYIERKSGNPVLRINQNLLPEYSSYEIECCYSNITRIVTVNKSDDQVKFSSCLPFQSEVSLSYPYIKVTCTDTCNRKVYTNVHAAVTKTKKYSSSLNKYEKWKHRPVSVIFVGIDSISKLNLKRTMPRTHNFLENNYINIKGYNKIGDNTFPNLMAILTGKTRDKLYETCNPQINRMNNCDIIWDRFSELGYTTAYAEDQCNIGTFNYDRMGFAESPTDFYYRPYMLAAEKLGLKYKYGMAFCSGPETSGERVLNAAKDFATEFHDVPIFGLFWMNTFSHDNINCPSAMDDKVLQFLSDTSFNNALNDTIVIFFSDHGFRFGDIRFTHTGWLEERLPFIYAYIPNNFKQRYLIEYRNFLINSKRLTTPFDLHMTLQHVLYLADRTYKIQSSDACPKCQSLFKEIDESRTCEDGAIAQHWCTCNGHNYVNSDDLLVVEVANYVVAEINKLVESFSRAASNCVPYRLKKVNSAGMSEKNLNEKNESVNIFLVILETRPNAVFEATVEASLRIPKHKFRLLGDISRLNKYADYSYCVSDSLLKKYCYCSYGVMQFLKNTIQDAVCVLTNC